MEGNDPHIVRSLRGHKESITALSFHPGCRYVASAGADDVIFLWDLYRYGSVHKFQGHKSEIHALKFSPNGNILASVSKDETLKFWEVNYDTDREMASVKAHSSRIRNLAWSCDALLVGTCGDDKLIKIWSSRDRKLEATFKGHQHWVRNLEFSPWASNLASCDDKNILIWDVYNKKIVQEYNGYHNGVIHSVRFHKLGNCLASCSHDRKIKIFDLRTQKVIQTYDAHRGPVTSIDFHPYSAALLSTSYDGKTKIWDLKKGCLSYTLDTHSSYAVFSRHGDYFLTGGSYKLLNVWRTRFADSGREHININELAQQKPVTKNPPYYLVVGRQTNRSDDNTGGQYIIYKENLHNYGNTPLIYVHEQEPEHFETAGRSTQQTVNHDNRIPSKLASKLRTLSCQLDFITKTVQVLDARVANNHEQLERIKAILK